MRAARAGGSPSLPVRGPAAHARRQEGRGSSTRPRHVHEGRPVMHAPQRYGLCTARLACCTAAVPDLAGRNVAGGTLWSCPWCADDRLVTTKPADSSFSSRERPAGWQSAVAWKQPVSSLGQSARNRARGRTHVHAAGRRCRQPDLEHVVADPQRPCPRPRGGAGGGRGRERDQRRAQQEGGSGRDPDRARTRGAVTWQDAPPGPLPARCARVCDGTAAAGNAGVDLPSSGIAGGLSRSGPWVRHFPGSIPVEALRS
jgi:hypothetical protein